MRFTDGLRLLEADSRDVLLGMGRPRRRRPGSTGRGRAAGSRCCPCQYSSSAPGHCSPTPPGCSTTAPSPRRTRTRRTPQVIDRRNSWRGGGGSCTFARTPSALTAPPPPAPASGLPPRPTPGATATLTPSEVIEVWSPREGQPPSRTNSAARPATRPPGQPGTLRADRSESTGPLRNRRSCPPGRGTRYQRPELIN